MAEWNEAYETVESYFTALGLRNKLLLSSCIHRVLKRVAEQYDPLSKEKPATLAMREAMTLVADWLQRVLGIELPDHRLAARGRLALMLADLKGRWQPWFLADAPWPEEFVHGMRASYLSAGPAFQERTMTPRPIELSPLASGLSGVIESLDKLPHVRRLILGLLTAVSLVGAMIFFFY
ncbi:MAG: hypothetical protein SNJ52_03820 [Verrucomicrobiia bacterium]